MGQKIVWRGSPSQWVNMKPFTIAILIFIVVIGVNAAGLIDAVFQQYLPGAQGLKPLVKTILFLAPVLACLWPWLQVKFHHYELTEEVFREHYGVLNRTVQEMELYRVNDTMTYRPFELNVVGLGNVVIHTSDSSDPTVVIAAVKDPDNVRQMLRHYVEIQRQRKGIVEVANYGG